MRFETVVIPNYPAYRLGKSSDGTPALLIDAKALNGASPPPIKLEALSVFHRASCLISVGGVQEQKTFSVASLSLEGLGLKDYFLDLIPLISASLGKEPTAHAVATAFDALIALFRAANRPMRGTVQGLWAELFVLSQARDPKMLVSCWHADVNDRYDFHAGAQRAEVKSAAHVRKHRFSLEQVSPPADAEVIIVSIITASVATGLTAKELLDALVQRLAGYPQLQMKAFEAVASTLGDALQHGLLEPFDAELARASMRFYDARDLPALTLPIPPEIDQVRFAIDLSSCISLSEAQVRARGGLFAALITS